MEKINLQPLADVTPNPISISDSSVRNPAQKKSIESEVSVTNSLPSTKIESTSKPETLAEFSKKNQENLEQAVKEINAELVSRQSELGFSVDTVTDKSVVTVTRRDSGEIVRQIPSESFLKVAHSLEQLKGVLFDKFFLKKI
jgi:flagellar protein FlaG